MSIRAEEISEILIGTSEILIVASLRLIGPYGGLVGSFEILIIIVSVIQSKAGINVKCRNHYL